jgi:hypothetical protein
MLFAAGTTDEDGSRHRDEQVSNPVIRLALKIRGSFLAFIGAMGVALVVLAVIIEVLSVKRGVVQGMFLLWGISSILYSLGGFVFLNLIGYR